MRAAILSLPEYFSLGENDLETTSIVQRRINTDTGDTALVKQRSRRIPFAKEGDKTAIG